MKTYNFKEKERNKLVDKQLEAWRDLNTKMSFEFESLKDTVKQTQNDHLEIISNINMKIQKSSNVNQVLGYMQEYL